MTSTPMTTTLARAVLHEAEQRRDVAHQAHVLALSGAMKNPRGGQRHEIVHTAKNLADALGNLILVQAQVDEILRRDGNAS